jgi:hypothetical protein
MNTVIAVKVQVQVPLVEEVSVPTPTHHTITQGLLVKDRERATDVLLQLRYQLSRTVSSIEVK